MLPDTGKSQSGCQRNFHSVTRKIEKWRSGGTHQQILNPFSPRLWTTALRRMSAVVCRVHVRGRHQSTHDGGSREEPSCGRRTWLVNVATRQRNGSAPRPGRDVSGGAQILNAIRKLHVAAPAFRSQSSPVVSIACIVTASLRATATAACLSRSSRGAWGPMCGRPGFGASTSWRPVPRHGCACQRGPFTRRAELTVAVARLCGLV